MFKKFLILLAIGSFLLLTSGILIAADEPTAKNEGATASVEKASRNNTTDGKTLYFVFAISAAAVCMCVAAVGTGLAQGHVVGKSVEGIARQPEASKTITTTMIIGLAMIESIAIYALVISLIILIVNPFTKFFS